MKIVAGVVYSSMEFLPGNQPAVIVLEERILLVTSNTIPLFEANDIAGSP